MLILTLLLSTVALNGTALSPVPVQKEPMHHVVYSDERLRVYDIVIPPHARTLYHVHLHDLVGVTIAPGATRDEKLGSRPLDEPPDKPFEVWFAPHPQRDVHRVINLGGTPIHMVVVELLSRGRHVNPAAAAGGSPAGVVELDNRGVRVVRYSLAPGTAIPSHAGVLVALGPGRIAGACTMQGSQTITAAGFVCVDAEPTHRISNVDDHPIDLLQFQLNP